MQWKHQKTWSEVGPPPSHHHTQHLGKFFYAVFLKFGRLYLSKLAFFYFLPSDCNISMVGPFQGLGPLCPPPLAGGDHLRSFSTHRPKDRFHSIITAQSPIRWWRKQENFEELYSPCFRVYLCHRSENLDTHFDRIACISPNFTHNEYSQYTN